MGKNKVVKEELFLFIFQNIDDYPKQIIRITSDKFKVSRQTVRRYMQELISDGEIRTSGEGRNTTYFRNPKTYDTVFDKDGLDEELVWRNHVKPVLPDLSQNVMDICHYGVTEIVNNAIEHSGANKVWVEVSYDWLEVKFTIKDDGIGIFTKIQQDFNLSDKRHSILELAKGKLTSDPLRHSGEGIFFTSRMFDRFVILSEDLTFFGHDNDDWLFSDLERSFPGTLVMMTIERRATRSVKEVFDRFAPESGEFGFQKTIVPVKLMQYEGDNLVSRSQAKRLIHRFEQFREVILDFDGVKFIGQPFADELFRVFKNSHPEVHLYVVNTNEDVDKMIKHGTSAAKP